MAPSYPQTMDIHAGRYSGTSSTANIDGTASQPAIAFGDDQDTGIYSPSNNKIGLSTGGAETVCVDSSGLDLASGKVIKINGSTVLTATSFTGNAASVTIADESSDTTCFPLFATAATGNLSPKSGSNLTFNSSSGLLTATSFAGASTTQSAGDNSTKLATTAYVDTATAALVDSAPSNLNTLNELAAALNDDADLANTVNTSIATKLPLAGGQMTGNITFSGSQTVDGRDLSADGTKLDGIAASATAVGGASGVDFNDDVNVRFGTGDDTSIFFDGTRTAINTGSDTSNELRILTAAAVRLGKRTDATAAHAENMLRALPDGAVEIFYDGTKKLETTSGGIDVAGSGSFTSHIDINADDKKLRIGAANDLELFHDATNSLIDNNTGNLYINSAGDIYLCPKDNEAGVYVRADGAVELYHDNGKKAQTYASGLEVIGHLIMGDNDYIQIGDSQDLKIYHDGSHSHILSNTGNLRICADGAGELVLTAKSGEESIVCEQDGPVDVMYDNSKKFETTSYGAKVTGRLAATTSFTGSDSVKVILGDGDDLEIYHDGTDARFHNSTGRNVIRTATNTGFYNSAGSENLAIFTVNGACELYYDNSKKFYTGNAGVAFVGNLYGNDNEKIILGSGGDLEIFHNGTDTVIQETVNNRRFLIAGDEIVIRKGDLSEDLAKFNADEDVALYYNNAKKFETQSDGCQVSGHLRLASDGDTIRIGADADLLIHHSSSNNYIESDGGDLYIDTNAGHAFRVLTDQFTMKNAAGNETIFTADADGAVSLYYNGIKHFETNADGVKCNEDFRIPEGKVIRCGNTTYGDIKIYRDASLNYIDTDNANLHIRVGSDEKAIVCVPDGDVNLYYNNALKLHTTTGGVYITGSVTESSDIALKRNITLIDNALDKIKQIKGYTYQLKENGQSSVGVIAQEVEKVFPQLVHGQEGSKGVDYSGLIGALIESVKELNTEVVTNASDIVNNESRLAGCTSNVSGVIDDDKIESKTKIQDGIRKIKALSSYQVTLKEDSKIRDGFLSSDVKTIYGREETSLIPTLTAALSEAIQKIEALEAKVSALEAK